MRLPYAPRDPPPSTTTGEPDPETAKIYQAIAARRAPRPLIPLDLTLLHSPPVASGYNAFVGALRTKTIFPEALLELSICRIAVLNSAVYEWNAHAPLALKAGLKPDVLDYARRASTSEIRTTFDSLSTYPDDHGDSSHKEALPLTKEIITTLLYTDEVTVPQPQSQSQSQSQSPSQAFQISDSTFASLRQLFGDREIVELTSCIAGYNGVSRILVALDVGENNKKEMKSVQEIQEGLKGWEPSA